MDNKDPQSGDNEPRHLLAQAERQLWASGQALDAVIADIKAGKFGASKDISAAISGLRKGLEAVFSERAKLEKYDAEHGNRSGELDLAAARAEVRRRMARLRAAVDPGGISGGDE